MFSLCDQGSGHGLPERVLVPEEVTEDLSSFPLHRSLGLLPGIRGYAPNVKKGEEVVNRWKAEAVDWFPGISTLRFFASICTETALISKAILNHKEI